MWKKNTCNVMRWSKLINILDRKYNYWCFLQQQWSAKRNIPKLTGCCVELLMIPSLAKIHLWKMMLTYLFIYFLWDQSYIFDSDVHMVRSRQALGNVFWIPRLDGNAKWFVMTLRASINIPGWTNRCKYVEMEADT